MRPGYNQCCGYNTIGFLEVLATEEGQEAAGDILSTVTSFFKDLIKGITIGDQVPEYPIKSKNTLQKIITDIEGRYPPPKSVAEAKQQLVRVQQDAVDHKAGGTPVLVTYGMLFDKLAQVLQNYIESKGYATNNPYPSPNPNRTNLCPDGTPVDSQGMCRAPADDDGKKNNMLLYGGIALAAILLLRKKK
jgi:hypothetical protein